MILQLFYDNQTIESDFYLEKKKMLVARMSGSKEEKYHMKDFPSTRLVSIETTLFVHAVPY